MAQSKSTKKLFNMAYGLGASIVIIGALFKILHWDFGFPFDGNTLLTVGLVTEALIFAISAFEPIDDDLDWSLVYPELAGMNDDSMSPVRELDNMLEKAKVDGELIKSLGEGLRKVNKAANGIGSVTDIADSTQEYSKQVTAAAKKLENINGLYEAQIASSTEQTEATRRMASNMTASLDNAQQMQVELEMLSKNLNALNGVYGNMLNAMNYNK